MNDDEFATINLIQAANWFLRADLQLKDEPSNAMRERIRDDALVRYLRAEAAANRGRDERAAESVATIVERLESNTTSHELKDFFIDGATMLAVATIFGGAAGAVGAVLVKEKILEEVVKGTIGSSITTAALFATERFILQPRRTHVPGVGPQPSAAPTRQQDTPLPDEEELEMDLLTGDRGHGAPHVDDGRSKDADL
jgi:hypothetical protein